MKDRIVAGFDKVSMKVPPKAGSSAGKAPVEVSGATVADGVA